MYIPSTQKLGLKKKKKNSQDFEDLQNFEPDEHKIEEIENNIFSKITESVDKIFNIQDTRSTFTGYAMIGTDLEADHGNNYRMSVAVKEDKTLKVQDQFDEIVEAPEEEEKETKRGTV